jgi:hypothetical protein
VSWVSAFVIVGFLAVEARAGVLSNPGWSDWVASGSGSAYDGFVNFGTGPYPAADTITTGNAQPWYTSPQVAKLFGGTPTAAQQADFQNTVMQRVEQTFQQSGVSVSLTADPSAGAAHTLSVVSNTSAALLPSAIGMTYIGGNGFSFVDQEAATSNSVNQLEWIVAHNLSHELMLAFGVPENYDQTGNFIDARNASFAMITNPNSVFSPAAAQALNQALAQPQSPAVFSQGAQVVGAAVPEPASVAVWALGGVALFAARRRLAA